MFLAAAVWSSLWLAELGKGREGGSSLCLGITDSHVLKLKFPDFLEQMFLHLQFALRTISRGLNYYYFLKHCH